MINNKYQASEQIGQGKFGVVLKGHNIKTQEPVAIKIERETEIKFLKHETTILNYLYRNGCRNIPIVYWYGKPNETNICLIMPFYECSLYDYSKKEQMSNNHIMDMMRTSLKIAESIHTHFVIHRDIKPHNFMLKNDQLFLIDFGLASIYNNNGEHEENKQGEHIIGTSKYISINVHNGHKPSRRDDVISIGYVFLEIWLIQNDNINLPWHKCPISNGEYEREHILYDKNQWQMIQKIEYTNNNNPINNYINQAYQLEFRAKPNYEFILL
jgi:serine/threonine protein kinase